MKVLIADDQTAVREGLRTLLQTMPGIEVVGVAGNGEEAAAMVGLLVPDVVLMDLRMPVVDGVEATRQIRAGNPSVQVVVLTTYADGESIIGALRAGAIGYLTKDAGRDNIRRALDAAYAGQAILDLAVQRHLAEVASSPQPLATDRPDLASGRPDRLTEREVEVLQLIAAGFSNTELAGQPYIGEATVKTHINRIFAKTGSRDRAQAVAYAHRHNLVR